MKKKKEAPKINWHSPDYTVLQPSSDDVDRHALRLVGEGHGANDLSAVDVTDEVAVHRPQT